MRNVPALLHTFTHTLAALNCQSFVPGCAIITIFKSGEDLDYPASELNTHGPTVQGWRSPRDDSLRSPPARPPSVPRPPPPTAQPTSSSSSSGGSPPLPGQQTSTAVPASAACVQEIVLRFQQPANICRIQVLAHQFMIRESMCSCVEIM